MTRKHCEWCNGQGFIYVFDNKTKQWKQVTCWRCDGKGYTGK